MEDPDQGWVIALQRGDEEALNELMARHKEAIHRFIYRSIQNEEEALDLTQETFVKAYFNIQSYKPTARFSTWLYQIALNLCRDYLRSRGYKQKRLTFSLFGWGEDQEEVFELPSETHAQPDESVHHAELVTALNRGIQQLPDPLREAFILAVMEDRSHLEVAEILNTSAKTVETRVYRARKQLSKLLAPFREG